MTSSVGVVTDDLAALVLHTADQLAIVDLMHRYARGIDDFDGALLSSCFLDDCRYVIGDRTLVGRRELAKLFDHSAGTSTQLGLDHIEMFNHMVSNVEAEIKGDAAKVISLTRAHVIGPRNGSRVMLVRCVRYDDEVVRQGSVWVIAERRHALRWSYEVDPAIHHRQDQSRAAWPAPG